MLALALALVTLLALVAGMAALLVSAQRKVDAVKVGAHPRATVRGERKSWGV